MCCRWHAQIGLAVAAAGICPYAESAAFLAREPARARRGTLWP